MLKTTFIINNNFITLGQFLKLSKNINSGGQARSFLVNNPVLVNGNIEQRRGKKLYNSDSITVFDKQYIIETKGN
jgi:S4 domain protein YaaA